LSIAFVSIVTFTPTELPILHYLRRCADQHFSIRSAFLIIAALYAHSYAPVYPVFVYSVNNKVVASTYGAI
jgi:hypothetical protein